MGGARVPRARGQRPRSSRARRALHGRRVLARIHSQADVARHLRLRAEFQTLRRLKRHPEYLLFTVRTYVQPLCALAAHPHAARALGAAVRLKPKGILYYQSMHREQAQRALLGYLDALAGEPWRCVPEPWERSCPEDGTFAAEAERAARRRERAERWARHAVIAGAVALWLAARATR